MATLLNQALVGTVNGTNTSFDLPSTPTASFDIIRDGLYCIEDPDGVYGTLGYQYASPTGITFNAAPEQFAACDIS